MWWQYSDEYYEELLRDRQRKIDAALEEMPKHTNYYRRLPYDLQERILRDAGLLDMPPRGEWIRPHTSREFYG
jgi:hypothetical protein